jgi:hypothetical protein
LQKKKKQTKGEKSGGSLSHTWAIEIKEKNPRGQREEEEEPVFFFSSFLFG